MPETLAPPETMTTQDITAIQARAAVDAAVIKAVEFRTRMNIAVLDTGGNLKAFLRMDGAWLGSIDIAIRKAKTARFFDMPTGDIGGLSQPGGPLYGIEHSNEGLITFPGGVPVYSNPGGLIDCESGGGVLLGGVGVSGDGVEQDEDGAEGAIQGAGFCTQP